MSDERWSEWKEHNGETCPIPYDAVGEAQFRDGKVEPFLCAGSLGSCWNTKTAGKSTIIAYRYKLPEETLTPEQEADAHKEQGLMTLEERELPAREHQYSPYFKDVRHIDTLDVYRVLDLFEVEKHGHPISHAAKKLLLSGVRTGGKDVEADIREAIDSLMRWLEMREEDNGKV